MYIVSIESNGSTNRELFMTKISVKDLSIEEKIKAVVQRRILVYV